MSKLIMILYSQYHDSQEFWGFAHKVQASNAADIVRHTTPTLHTISWERVKLENLDAWHTMRYFMALDSSDPNKYHQIIENM